MKTLILLLFLFSSINLMGQQAKVKTLSELINKKEPGWELVTQWVKEAKNKVEILPKDKARADKALLETQITTRSPMGAIVYESGGILVDDGWIRILGSGSNKMNRSLMAWNHGKSFNHPGEHPSFLLVADDAIGGFFAINAGAFGKEDINKIFYYAPDNLTWEPLGLGYSDFLVFCFSGDLNKFYEGLRWNDWRKDVKAINGNKAYSCFPYLWTKEGKDINKVSRKAVPIEELWNLHNAVKK